VLAGTPERRAASLREIRVSGIRRG
jgi:hypothetical protein